MKMKSLKKIAATVLAVAAISSFSAVTTYAIFDEDSTSTSESSVIDSYTFDATVTRVTNGAMQVTPEASANLGDKLAVTYPNAMDNFAVGDTVTITYSGSVKETNGMKAVDATSIVKKGGASEDTTPVTVTEDKPAETTKPATTTTTSSDNTPNTGDAGIAAMAALALLSGSAFGAYSLVKRKDD